MQNIRLFRLFTLTFQDLAAVESATESDILTPRCVSFQLCLFQPVFQFVVNAFFLLPLFGKSSLLSKLLSASNKK